MRINPKNIKRRLLKLRQQLLSKQLKPAVKPRDTAVKILNLWVDKHANVWFRVQNSSILSNRLYGISPGNELLDRNAKPIPHQTPLVQKVIERVRIYKRFKDSESKN
jgi:hypothetical protein